MNVTRPVAIRRSSTVATIVVATLAFVIAIAIFLAVAELFVRDGAPWQHVVVAEHVSGALGSIRENV